jgi:hypothetical protein
MTNPCQECHDLKRNLVIAAGEHRSLKERTVGRHVSAPERRRLHRLLTEASVARQELEAHWAICKERTPATQEGMP